MKILFIHQNFPGQFKNLVPELQLRGHDVKSISSKTENIIINVGNQAYSIEKKSTPGIHPWLINTESAIIRGEAVAKAAQRLLDTGWIPDVVLGHTGWGEMLFVKEVFHSSKILTFNELFYNSKGGDVNFDPEFPYDSDASRKLHVRNFHLTSSLINSDDGVTPTLWQANTFPDFLKTKLRIIHDGIRTDIAKPNPGSWIKLKSVSNNFTHGDEIVTFVSRNLEPMRGFHYFMRALPEILSKRPNARIIIVGGDEVSYGLRAPTNQSYKQKYTSEIINLVDFKRIHFVGNIPYSLLLELFRVTSVHVYLTMPFVLSWSMLEAMSCGALIVGSDTPPVKEVISHEFNGLLVDFFSPEQISKTVVECLENPIKYSDLRINARRTVVDCYDFKSIILPKYIQWIENI